MQTALDRYFDVLEQPRPATGRRRADRRRHLRGPDHRRPALRRRARRERRGRATRVSRRALRARERGDRRTTTAPRAQWRMIGTNTGPLPGGPATGGPLDLPGADFFTYDADADRVSCGRRLLRHRHHARPARAAGPHHPGRHGRRDRVRHTACASDRSRHDPRRLHRHLDRDRPRAPVDARRRHHRDRDGAARQRRLPRHLLRHHRPTATTRSPRGPTPEAAQAALRGDAHTRRR